MTDYSWVTQEMFDNALQEYCSEMTVKQILDIPGIYEILSEYFNNEVLAELESNRELDMEE